MADNKLTFKKYKIFYFRRMKKCLLVSRVPLLLSIVFLSMFQLAMSQLLKNQRSGPSNKSRGLRSDLPPSSHLQTPHRQIQEPIFASDSDVHHEVVSPTTASNPQNEFLDTNGKTFLFDAMSQKMKNSKNTEGSITFTREPDLMRSLHRHDRPKVSQYVRKVVENNRKFIQTHNSDRKKSYKLAENRFIIYTQDQFKEIFLNLKTPDQTYVKHFPKNMKVVVPLNSLRRNLQQVSIDWKAANRMTSVKFQRQCGSCYAFTAISAIESAYILKGRFLNLAEQELVDCSNPYGNFGCTGGWTTNAYKYIKDFGLVSERQYPYNASANKCTVENGNNKVLIKNFVQLKNDCSLVAEALKNQPLSIAINADGWQYYAKGIYTDCRAGVSNHGVVLAGMDSTSWLIKNSWGYSWGEDGYIRVSRTAPNKACNVCEWASYPVV